MDAFAWEVVGSVAAVVAAVATIVFVLVPLAQPRAIPSQVSDETLDARLDRLSSSLRESARLVEQVSAELDARAVTARQLKQEAEDAEALVTQHKDQVEAVRRLLRAEMASELKSAEKNIFRDSLRVAFGSFVLGGGVSFLITWLVHPLH